MQTELSPVSRSIGNLLAVYYALLDWRCINVVNDDHIPTLERSTTETTRRMVVVVVLQTTSTQVADGTTILWTVWLTPFNTIGKSPAWFPWFLHNISTPGRDHSADWLVRKTYSVDFIWPIVITRNDMYWRGNSMVGSWMEQDYVSITERQVWSSVCSNEYISTEMPVYCQNWFLCDISVVSGRR